MSALARLADLLRAEGGDLGERARAPDSPASPLVASAGPRTEARAEDYELVVEAIREGYELHFGTPRTVAIEPEDDLALLGGDHLYAVGLARLIELGDVPAVTELADVIGLAAVARAAGDGDLAEAVWAAGARAIGWGTSEAHGQAKALAAAGDPEAAGALRAAAA